MSRLWIHGASLGDMRAIHPFVAAWEDRFKESEITVTSWTHGGRTLGESLFSKHRFRRAPLPFRLSVRPFLRRHRPDLAVFEYLELYPAWVHACHAMGIPTLVIDGRVTHRSLRIRRLLRRTASRLNGFCAQTTDDAWAAERLGVDPSRIWICGNGKYDGLDSAAPCPSEALKDALGTPDIVIGSVHPDEESDALRALSQTQLSAVIAPRYLERCAFIERECHRLGLSVSRRSRGGGAERVRILDTYGELGAAYGLTPVSIIGGTFGRRNGQNLVEAAMHNNLIIHGPRTANIELERSVLSEAGAVQVRTWSDAFDVASRSNGSVHTRQAVSHLMGATQRNLEVALTLLSKNDACE